MADLDPGILRPWLDEYEMYATGIGHDDPRFVTAQKMLDIIVAARASLHPSADSTANYVANKDIILQLVILRKEADGYLESKTEPA